MAQNEAMTPSGAEPPSSEQAEDRAPMPRGHELKHIIEAALLAADEPLSMARIASLFEEAEQPSNLQLGKALESLKEDCADRGVELTEVASGFRLQVKSDLHDWVARLWTEKPQKYSRAMLETLSLIAYRQPITRGEIESVRGVSLSSNIIRSLQEREWIRIVGHRDVPGKPALFGTTKTFLDYFNLRSLDELPTLAEIKDMDGLEPELNLDPEEVAALNEALDEAAEHHGAHEQNRESPEPDSDEAESSDDDIPSEEDQLDDGPVDDDDLDAAFEDLDRAFRSAEAIDTEKETPAADAGVDADSPQADLVATAADEADPAETDPDSARDEPADSDEAAGATEPAADRNQ